MKNLIIFLILIVVAIFVWSMMKNDPVVTNLDNNNEIQTGFWEYESFALKDGEYVVDLKESSISWQARKKILIEWVDEGSISIISGKAISKDGVLSGDFIFDMNSISVSKTGRGGGEDRLIAHLKSLDFFDVVNYPTSKFVLKSVSRKSENELIISGDLTIKNKTNPISFNANFSEEKDFVVFTGSVIVDRTLYDVRFGSDKFFNNLGDNVIEDNFTLNFVLKGKASLAI